MERRTPRQVFVQGVVRIVECGKRSWSFAGIVRLEGKIDMLHC